MLLVKTRCATMVDRHKCRTWILGFMHVGGRHDGCGSGFVTWASHMEANDGCSGSDQTTLLVPPTLMLSILSWTVPYWVWWRHGRLLDGPMWVLSSIYDFMSVACIQLVMTTWDCRLATSVALGSVADFVDAAGVLWCTFVYMVCPVA